MKPFINSSTVTSERSIHISSGKLIVPENPVIPCIAGDGIGPEVWSAAEQVINTAVALAYHDSRKISWLPVLAGQTAFDQTGSWLPEETLTALRHYLVGIKGPLTTPVGGGIRSLNVALRRGLDLYTCLRPVRYFTGVPSPLRHPEQVNMVIFRENTEDVYAGVEFDAGTPEVKRLLEFMQTQFPGEYARLRFPESSALGIKPISQEGSARLVRTAIRYAIANKRRSVTLVHKGNIMKFTEGGFRRWGYAVAEQEFGSQVYTSLMWERTAAAQGKKTADQERQSALQSGKLWVNDIIADAMFEAALVRPQEFDVLATPNLNGDYLSDALAAEVGGIGIAPGANINFETGAAVFEATHGTAPTLAGQNRANPSSLILSGEMLLRYLGWNEAADLIIHGIEKTFASGQVTEDLAYAFPEKPGLSTSQFADTLVQLMSQG